MVTVKEFVRVRIVENRKAISELCSGDDLWRMENTWMNKRRVIDRKNNRYQKIVTRPQTGEVVHHCDEPLSEHRNHRNPKKRL